MEHYCPTIGEANGEQSETEKNLLNVEGYVYGVHTYISIKVSVVITQIIGVFGLVFLSHFGIGGSSC